MKKPKTTFLAVIGLFVFKIQTQTHKEIVKTD